MMSKATNFKMFSATTLKILACVFMLCDHIGVMFFKDVLFLRILGRLAYPIFAYFIMIGCIYTKNRLRRFLSVFVLGALCELFYIALSHVYYGNILLTFSASILLIYLFDAVIKAFEKSRAQFLLLLSAFVVSLVAVYFYCRHVGLDYGFFGVLAPLLAYVPNAFKNTEKLFKVFDKSAVSLALFAVGLVMIILFEKVLNCQIFSLCAILLLALYNGERGKYSLKYGFYLFYPLHLVLLQGIQLLINSF